MLSDEDCRKVFRAAGEGVLGDDEPVVRTQDDECVQLWAVRKRLLLNAGEGTAELSSAGRSFAGSAV